MAKNFVHETTKNSVEGNEYYTPPYAITPIFKYIKPNSTIWCPFDTEESHYVKMLRKEGHTVIHTHIDTGDDFFFTNIECDYIISNPPFSLKTEVLKRLYHLQKPFAMLLGVVGIFDNQERFNIFRDKPLEILIFDKRISFFKSYEPNSPTAQPPFQSVYICSMFLPKQIISEKLKKK